MEIRGTVLLDRHHAVLDLQAQVRQRDGGVLLLGRALGLVLFLHLLEGLGQLLLELLEFLGQNGFEVYLADRGARAVELAVVRAEARVAGARVAVERELANAKIKKVYWVTEPNPELGELYWELRYDPGKGESIADCLSLDGNPSLEDNWPMYEISYVDNEGAEQKMELPLTIADWALDIERRNVPVATEKFQTSIPGIFAVGDINTYPGKKKLILSGFHEAALAAFGVQAHIHPDQKVRLQYTTTSPVMHKRLGLED